MYSNTGAYNMTVPDGLSRSEQPLGSAVDSNMALAGAFYPSSGSGAGFSNFSSSLSNNIIDSCSFSSVDSTHCVNRNEHSICPPATPFASHLALWPNANQLEQTISPTQLKRDQSPLSSLSDPAKGVSYAAQGAYLPGAKAGTEPKRRPANQKNRRELPDKAPKACAVATTSIRSSSSSRTRSPIRKSTSGTSKLTSGRIKIAPKASSQKPQTILTPDQQREEKNALLERGRRAGMTYGQIKSEYDWSDAESTLRGRYRTMMKKPHERVRKPKWQARDVSQCTQCDSYIIN
jgi:hypothetical protein